MGRMELNISPDPGQSLVLQRYGEPPITLTFGGGNLTAECMQASIDSAIGPGGVHVVTAAEHEARKRDEKHARHTYRATDDRRGWLEASWQCINGGEPSRERRFHALGCRWQPSSRNWACASDCNVPRWKEEAAADE